ncbi:hypothetical protein [Gemmatimonas sp.]|uniref:hypothetical protein n=1 Tax=Gemmatimonas sp. TaxID=1962908 RepID=UPI00356B2FF4
MNTISYTDVLEQLRSDRDQTEQRLSALRSGIAAFERLADPTGLPKKSKRAKATASTQDVPTELIALGTKERIVHVMNADPTRTWTVNTLSAETHVASLSSIRTTVGRLAIDGDVSHNPDDQTWTWVTAPATLRS